MSSESPDFADFYQAVHPGLVAEFYACTGDLEESRESGRTAGILEDLEKDARRLSDRLRERGFGC